MIGTEPNPVLLAASDLFRSVQSYLDRLWSGNYSITVVALEMLLIGSVVYTVLRFLQGTRGARLIKGVALVLMASFVVIHLIAQQFDLDRIIYLYPYFVSGVFLVALVVFQTELRRGLMRLGEGRFWPVRGRHIERIVEPIVEAAARMAKRRVGALIAIERSTEVGTLVESGVRINGELTVELLESIFWPGSSLHDMGVIIQRGRISAAACQFPLAESEDVERTLGSRHRAALGMSQESDALVVVVSEETGIISLAEHGKLRRGLTPEELENVLTAAFYHDVSDPTPKEAGRPVAAAPSSNSLSPKRRITAESHTPLPLDP